MRKRIVRVSLTVLFIDIISKLLISHFMIRVFIIIMCLIILGFIIYYIGNNKINLLDSIGFGLVIGGALGNLIDRVIYGYVIDFIDIYVFDYNYPIFNIADMGVVIGVIIILISSFMKERSVKNGDNRR